MLKSVFALPATVWLLGLVSLMNDSASELLYPLVPLYLASVLMAGPKALGIIEGIAEATSSLLKLFAGVLADKTASTKPWVVGGYSLAAVARPLMAFAAAWPVVLALRFADRVGKGLRTSPRDALLASSVDPAQRGLAFGLHRAMDNAGAVIGPLVATLLLGLHLPLRDIFLWTAVPGAIAIALALCIREPSRVAKASRVPFSWTLQGFPPAFKRYLLVLALFTLGNSSNMFLLLRARELGLPDVPDSAAVGFGLDRGDAVLHPAVRPVRPPGPATANSLRLGDLRGVLSDSGLERRPDLAVVAVVRWLRSVPGGDRGRGKGPGRGPGARRPAGHRLRLVQPDGGIVAAAGIAVVRLAVAERRSRAGVRRRGRLCVIGRPAAALLGDARAAFVCWGKTMIEIEIPGFGALQLAHLVLDYNGTLAVNGDLIEGVKSRLSELAGRLDLHVVTADTFGKAAQALDGMDCRLLILPPENQAAAKADYVRQLGERATVAMGNGRNDRLMLEQAVLGIAILGEEGAATAAIMAADVVVRDVFSALELLRNPRWLVATLRS